MAEESGSGSNQSTARKTTTKKTATKKTAARKAPAKRAAGSAPRAEAPRRPSAVDLAAGAARQLAELTGKQVEGITGVQRSDDGWQVEVELLELRRIPDTTDVLASYEVEVDSSGDLQGYRRTRRYVRGQAEGRS